MRRLADWVGGALSGVVAYRLWKQWQQPDTAAVPVSVAPDERAEELRAKLAEARASEEPGAPKPPEEPGEPADSLEERRRRVHEEGRAAIDRMNDT